MLRQFVVALAVSLPLAAQVSDVMPLLRVDVVALDAQGNRLRGLTAADFEIVENGERRAVADFVEYSSAAKPVAVTDTQFVSLVAAASPTPRRRLTVVFGDGVTAAEREAAMIFIQQHTRGGDIVSVAGDGTLDSRIASSVLQLARHPEKRGIVVYGPVKPEAIAFARRRGVTLVTPESIGDLSDYYSISFRGRGPDSIQVKTTRPSTLHTTFAAGPVAVDDAMGDRVLLNHFVPPRTNLLGLQLAASPPVADGEKRNVKLSLILPIRNLTLARDGGKVTGGFDVYVSIGDGKGNVAPVNKQSHSINWPPEAFEQAGDRSMTYTVDLVLDPGPARISVGVVDRRSKRTGYARIEVSG